jgi:hypothetical protein
VEHWFQTHKDDLNSAEAREDKAYSYIALDIRSGRPHVPLDEEFIVQFYLSTYPDLEAAFGLNYTKAREHWTNTGLPVEGRRGSREFDVQFYLNNYPDLQTAFGTNYALARDHWISRGLPVEGRRGSREFDVKFYLNTYPDLQTAFGSKGTKYVNAIDHWIHTGMAEGRKGSP